MDEGLADVYSTIEQRNGTIRLGLPVEGRLAFLRLDGLAFSLPVLFSPEQHAEHDLRSNAPRSRFYAESWILVHMLRFSPEYAAGFDELVKAMDRGTKESDAFSAIYKKSEMEVQRDLGKYLKAEWLPTRVLQVAETAPGNEAAPEAARRQTVSDVLDDLSFAVGLPEMDSR
jgi:hypothetical protein